MKVMLIGTFTSNKLYLPFFFVNKKNYTKNVPIGILHQYIASDKYVISIIKTKKHMCIIYNKLYLK